MQNGDEALPSISLAGRGQLVIMLITHEPHGIRYFDQILLTYTLKHCLATDMHNWDEALPTNSTVAPASPIIAPASPTINSGTALITDTDCSSIYSPKPLDRACILHVFKV